jgi:hypothetical protein
MSLAENWKERLEANAKDPVMLESILSSIEKVEVQSPYDDYTRCFSFGDGSHLTLSAGYTREVGEEEIGPLELWSVSVMKEIPDRNTMRLKAFGAIAAAAPKYFNKGMLVDGELFIPPLSTTVN